MRCPELIAWLLLITLALVSPEDSIIPVLGLSAMLVFLLIRVINAI